MPVDRADRMLDIEPKVATTRALLDSSEAKALQKLLKTRLQCGGLSGRS